MKKGRVTIPTNLDVVPQTLEILDEWGADAIRDCDGTEFPKELKDTGSKIYATYYTTRKDNEWAKAHPEEIQQMYIMTSFHTAVSDTLEIHLMDHLYPDMLKVNSRDDITRWWEVIDRTTGEVVPPAQWEYSEETGDVTIHERASVWYGAVVRGDTSYAVVGPGANVQDGAGARKAYIQASLHADELPGMRVAVELKRRLAELEAAGQLRRSQRLRQDNAD